MSELPIKDGHSWLEWTFTAGPAEGVSRETFLDFVEADQIAPAAAKGRAISLRSEPVLDDGNWCVRLGCFITDEAVSKAKGAINS